MILMNYINDLTDGLKLLQNIGSFLFFLALECCRKVQLFKFNVSFKIIDFNSVFNKYLIWAHSVTRNYNVPEAHASITTWFCVLMSWPNPSTGNVIVYASDWLMHFLPPLIGRCQPRRAVIGPAPRTGSVISSGSRGLSQLSGTWLIWVKGVRFNILSSRLDELLYELRSSPRYST